MPIWPHHSYHALAMKFDVSAITHVGRVRTSNEDALLADVERGLFVVADGMGGTRQVK
jgi:serine/threonine protein phosphatase PrpC